MKNQIKRAMGKIKNWSTDDACPICKKPFRSGDCPHTTPQAQDQLTENYIRAIVRDEMGKQ